MEGHTDNIPISTEQYPSNWELSTARAIAVAKIMMKNGVSSDKINVAGYGELHAGNWLDAVRSLPDCQ